MSMRRSFRNVLLLLLLVACNKVPISGREQVNLLSEERMMTMGAQGYQDFLKKNEKKVLPEGHPKSKLVQKVGERIKNGAREYLVQNNFKDRIDGFEWAFNVVKSDMANAFCMPGGRVVFYTGIMDIADNREELIAVVMGHEVAHAVARHGNERMSQQLMIRTGATTLSVATREQPEVTQDILMQAYGVGSRLGSLKYSRKHEAEADKMGLVFMAKAGYDPHHAVDFWKKMKASTGGQPPEFLSTHPNHDTRIQELKDFMPKAMKFYKPSE
jgi:predicted Zn-dependent protease